MSKDIDFSKGRRGPAIVAVGKTRITIMLDDHVLDYFRNRAEAQGIGYQTQINQVLRDYIVASTDPDQSPLTVEKLREVLRQELKVR